MLHGWNLCENGWCTVAHCISISDYVLNWAFWVGCCTVYNWSGFMWIFLAWGLTRTASTALWALKNIPRTSLELEEGGRNCIEKLHAQYGDLLWPPETSLVWESSRNLPNISRKSRLVMITCTACQVFSCCTCRLYRRPWLQPGAKELKTKSAGLISNERLVVMYPENLHESRESCFLVGFVAVVVFSLVVTYNPNLYTLSQVRICLFLIRICLIFFDFLASWELG